MASLEDLSPEQKQAINLGNLAKQLLANPETRESAQRLLKKGDAKLTFPELEIKDSVARVREEADEKVKVLAAKVQKIEAERALEVLHAKVRDAGLELEAVIKLMETHGLAPTAPNYDLAIRVLRQDAALAEPTSDSLRPADIPNFKEMLADPIGWRTREAEKIQREFHPRGI
jgi:hypothetical protein